MFIKKKRSIMEGLLFI